jgi:hypothetical protein
VYGPGARSLSARFFSKVTWLAEALGTFDQILGKLVKLLVLSF